MKKTSLVCGWLGELARCAEFSFLAFALYSLIERIVEGPSLGIIGGADSPTLWYWIEPNLNLLILFVEGAAFLTVNFILLFRGGYTRRSATGMLIWLALRVVACLLLGSSPLYYVLGLAPTVGMVLALIDKSVPAPATPEE